MLKRLVQLRSAVDNMALLVDDLFISVAEWTEIGNILDTLKAAKKATVRMQRADLHFCDLYDIWIQCEIDTRKIGRDIFFHYLLHLLAHFNFIFLIILQRIL